MQMKDELLEGSSVVFCVVKSLDPLILFFQKKEPSIKEQKALKQLTQQEGLHSVAKRCAQNSLQNCSCV